jgi:hypothetical protein
MVCLIVTMILAVSRQTGALGTRHAGLGVGVVWASYVYAAAMVWRAFRRMSQPPQRRGVVIPIVLHFVLAAFLLVHGSWHLSRG